VYHSAVRISSPRSTAVWLRDAFIVASLSWGVLLLAATYLAGRAHASMLASALLVSVYGLGSLVCHQLPQRSFHFWSAQMPVCARCAGLYGGAVVGALLAALTKRVEPIGAAERFVRSLRRARLVLGLAAVPTAITLVYEWSTGIMPSHAMRAVAGLPLGFAIAWLVVAAAENQVN